ncbi:hypothetical protein PCCS19_36010 [Paenibacillus sp. CCS19]|nr:hypothetical protein PCCS19_36010 [Paenibacillus cellulosilyticus]
MFANYDDVIPLSDMMEILAIGRNKAYELLHSGQINQSKSAKHIGFQKVVSKNMYYQM